MYPVKLAVVAPGSGFAAWMSEEDNEEQTHQEVVKRLDDFALVPTARGGRGSDASLLMWHRNRLERGVPQSAVPRQEANKRMMRKKETNIYSRPTIKASVCTKKIKPIDNRASGKGTSRRRRRNVEMGEQEADVVVLTFTR